MTIIETPRLILRTWKKKDAKPLFDINQDPKVLEFLRGPLTMQRIQDFISFMNAQFAQIKLALWAVEEKSSGAMMGYIGLDPVKWTAPFTPAIEISWRLGSQYWGQGYATEGAKAALQYGFGYIQLAEIVSFAPPINVRSIRVMEKIGMQRDLNGDFNHPKSAPGDRLEHHLLYRVRRSQIASIPT